MPVIPGFAGYIAPEQQRVLSLKTAVSERLPLAERAKQAAEAAVRSSSTPGPNSAVPRSYYLPKRHTGTTTYAEATQAYVRSGSDVPPRANERSFMNTISDDTARNATFDATATTKLATMGYCEREDESFYSRVRVLERRDDDARHSLEDPKTRSGAAKNLRCSAIQVKREHDPELAPEPLHFKKVERARPNATVTNSGIMLGAARSASAGPAAVCSPHSFSASSSFGKANFLASGSTHTLDYPDPRTSIANANATLNATMGKTLLASDRALVENATSHDLFAGTAKAAQDVCSGYMGHVPAHPSNVSRVNGSGDVRRAHTKNFISVTSPSSSSTTSLLRAKIAAAAAAAEAIRGRPLTPRTVGEKLLSTGAFARDERAMNRVEQGRKNAVRGFFTRGVGEQDDLVADQFCIRYRPLEGVMRHGGPESHGWISDTELRRSPRM
jgi:hypothetical protein